MFRRTQNENGTYNTLCLDCLMTVGRSISSPAAVAAVEERHLCVERALVQLFQANLNHTFVSAHSA